MLIYYSTELLRKNRTIWLIVVLRSKEKKVGLTQKQKKQNNLLRAR